MTDSMTASKVTAEDRSRSKLFQKYKSRIETNLSLSRSLVSYQANRKRPFYRWFKYKEGFSAALIEYVLSVVPHHPGAVLDPFAGTGAALFAAREAGWTATGIELLPVGIHAIQARLAAETIDVAQWKRSVQAVYRGDWKGCSAAAADFSHVRITQQAFGKTTERDLNAFRAFVRRIGDEKSRRLLELAALNILEEVSYTRKDGQYLRWDERSGRKLKGKQFHKGTLPSFESALYRQLGMMVEDLETGDFFSRPSNEPGQTFEILHGSCLERLTELPTASQDLVITSPPYCNRYDYSRTYALELAFLGVDEVELKRLRQAMLSCTVENRAKVDELRTYYHERNKRLFDRAVRAYDNQAALHEVLELLNFAAENERLNNGNIPRMVANYFFEMSLVVQELGRLTSPGGYVVMVNDNVQYAGQEVPVDLILAEFAGSAGFKVERIWTLGRGKGNSSQQMGAHGRRELRKCVYVWQKE
jgi:DNA modification methylase